MCKKIGILALAVVAGLFLLNKTNVGSYAGLAWSKVKAKAARSVPPEVELERIRNEIAQIQPDMKQTLSAMAEEMVAVDNLREDVNKTRAALAHQKDTILSMKRDVENAKDLKFVVYDQREYPVARIREKLARDWESYKVCEEGLKTKEKLLEAREQGLTVARENLAAMRAKKEQLEVEVAQLEAELKNVRLAQTRSNFQVDDSRLARINASLQGVRDRLKVMKTEQDLRGQFANDLDIPVEKKAKTAEVLKEIDDHFGKENADGVAASK